MPSIRALLPVSLVLLLCYYFVPSFGALGNKTITLPYPQTCMAARMEYVGRNRDCAKLRIDAVQHYERLGHSQNQAWRGDLCNVVPVYQNQTICQCDLALDTYRADNPTVSGGKDELWAHYNQNLEDIHRIWHCEKCLAPREHMCLAARRDYRLRYLNNFTEPAFHYYTFGISLGLFWNTTKCYPANMSEVIYMDNPILSCRAAESWYNNLNTDSRNQSQGGMATGWDHYRRYLMEYGAYWNATLCVDVENECLTGNNNCSTNSSLNLVCNNLIGDVGSFECVCASGYYGGVMNCTDINECTINPGRCGENGTCVNSIGGFNCTCNEGYYRNGSLCLDFDECEAQTDSCSSIQTCENTVGGYKCNCPVFYDNSGAYSCDYKCAYPWKSCWEGHCVLVDTDTCYVEPVCAFPSPYLCANNSNSSCAEAASSCTNSTSTCSGRTTCWDNSCSSSEDLCPTLPECPPNLRRCHDGSCALSCADTSCEGPKHQCYDGLCAQSCPINWNGCHVHLPYMCPDGSCTSNTSTCIIGNFTVARIQRAQAMTVFFPVGSVGPGQPNITIPVISDAGALILTIVLTEGYFANEVGLLAVTPLPDSRAYAAGNTTWGEYFEPSSKIFSGGVEILINGSDKAKPFEVHFDISVVSHLNMSDLCIGVINETTKDWQCHGSLSRQGNQTVSGRAVPGKMAIIQYIPTTTTTPRRQRTVGIYLFAAIVLAYSICLIFAALRDRKIFIEIVAETIKREGSVTAITGIPYQPAASDDPDAPTEQELLEEKRREMAKRGVSMPNIVLPDEIRAKHMSHTKHAVVIAGGGRMLSTLQLQPAEFYSGSSTERTARAMTFDSAYQPHVATNTSHRISFDPSIAVAPAIPPYNPMRVQRRRSGDTLASSPVSFSLPRESSQKSFRLSRGGGGSRSRSVLFNNNNSSSSISSDDDLRGAHEMDDLSRSQDLVSVPSPTPLVPRLMPQESPANAHLNTQARKLEWEMSVRAMALKPKVKDLQKMSLWDLMKLKHTWLSVWFTKRTSRLTCVEQATILLCMVIGNLGISAPFFDGKTSFDISASIIYAVVTASLVLFVTIFITLMFQNLKGTLSNLFVFALAFVFACFCIVLAMVYSYEFVVEATAMWISAFMIACLQDVLVNQPFKVLVIALLYGWFPADHWFVKLL